MIVNKTVKIFILMTSVHSNSEHFRSLAQVFVHILNV